MPVMEHVVKDCAASIMSFVVISRLDLNQNKRSLKPQMKWP